VTARYAIVAARFNETVVSRLVEGAQALFDKEQVENELTWVPGAFELPLVARSLADSGRFAGIVCLGAVIRGETSHFDFVAGESARGIMDVGLSTQLPVIFGVLTTETLEQAMDRAGGRHGNKGWDCAQAAIETAAVLAKAGRR
jgi:6,7-dimethyl-8-ribityllumazine synthase